MLQNHTILFYFFLLFYGSPIFINARPVDPLVSDGFEILDKRYTFEPLSSVDQGQYSESYNVIDGFIVDGKRIPAILKVVIDSNFNDTKSKTRKEIEFLGKPGVNLLLHWEWVKARVSYYIIVKNVQKDDPPFKPLYKHYLEDTNLVASEILQTARDNVFKRLLEFAEKDNLLYLDHHQRNVFFGRALQTVMPIDWGPEDKYTGVKEIAVDMDPEEKKSMIEHFEDSLKRHLPDNYCLDELEDDLFRHGKDLRLRDRDRRVFFQGAYRNLVRIKIERGMKTFRISGGFRGRPALLKIIKGLQSGYDLRQELEKNGLYLGSEEDRYSNRYYVALEDRHRSSRTDLGLT